MAKFADHIEKISETVTEGYKKIEDGVVSGYKKIEDGVVDGYQKIEDAFVDTFLAKNGESVKEAKARVTPGQNAVDEGRVQE